MKSLFKFKCHTIIVFIMLFSFFISNGQNHFLLKAALNEAKINDYENIYSSYINMDNHYSIGYNVEALYVFNLNKNWSINAGLTYDLRNFNDNSKYDYHYGFGMNSYIIHRSISMRSSYHAFGIPIIFSHSFYKNFDFGIGLYPYILSSHAKGQITQYSNSIVGYSYDVYNYDDTIAGLNSFQVDAEVLADYSLNKNWAIELSFQIGLTHLYKDDNFALLYYANDYNGGRFYIFSLGVVYSFK